MKRELPQHKVGELAYFDSITGMVPCKVCGVTQAAYSKLVSIKITSNTRLYKRGEILEFSEGHIVPRRNIRRRKYETVIVGEWEWVG